MWIFIDFRISAANGQHQIILKNTAENLNSSILSFLPEIPEILHCFIQKTVEYNLKLKNFLGNSLDNGIKIIPT